jgi:hypothetical protein
MKKYLALVAAGGALAIGVPAALAATDAPSTTPNTPVQSATPTPDQSRPDGGRDHNCPEKDGSGNQGSSSNSDTTL